MAEQIPPTGAVQTIPTFAVSKHSIDDFDKVSATKYLPRVQLMGNNSGQVTEGVARPGEYLLIRAKTDFNNLSKAWEGLVLAWRPKAMRLDKDGIYNIHDPAHAEFKKIKEDAELPGAFDRGVSFGPEFLVWVPRFKALATLFCNSKTARRSAQALKTILVEFQEKGKVPAVSFKSSVKEGGKFKWPGADFYECSTPITPMPEFEEEAFKETLDKFLNPPQVQKETLDASEAADRAR